MKINSLLQLTGCVPCPFQPPWRMQPKDIRRHARIMNRPPWCFPFSYELQSGCYVGNALALYLGGNWFVSRSGASAYWLRFPVILQFPQQNTSIVLSNKPRPHPSKAVFTRYCHFFRLIRCCKIKAVGNNVIQPQNQSTVRYSPATWRV
jgi:hypothetical protein